ncbi:protein BZR1 homolog 2-like [Asparagus officinalis]|uniref:protein BZR1 homolog 2-like n=1 Tax=Asparagus officinalis TaxID=4686 RepID=UPI00098E0705|nr:protein BZR1 homolog 2-like [Asparagus officinalis]
MEAGGDRGAKIVRGLRMYGNYTAPKHCDNNEVLKALCDEAGLDCGVFRRRVDCGADGTTYRKGCKPTESMEVAGPSISASPCSSYQPSPCASYNPSPASSALHSPASSHITNPNNPITSVPDANSLIPWLKNLSSASSSSSRPPFHNHNLYIHTGSISAPVTPPLSSPTARSQRIKTDWDDPTSQQPSWPPGNHYTFLPSSTPSSPRCQKMIPQPGWLSGPSSPTFSLVSSNPFGSFKGGIMSEGSSRMWTPGQSGVCSPVMPRSGACSPVMPRSGVCSPAMRGGPNRGDVHMLDCASDEFAFGSSSNGNIQGGGLVKAWEGERIHEECGSDELELTLGSSRTRAGT